MKPEMIEVIIQSDKDKEKELSFVEELDSLAAKHQLKIKQMPPTWKPKADELGQAETIILTLLVYPFIKKGVELAAQEFFNAIKELIKKFREKEKKDINMSIQIKKDEADPGITLNPENNERRLLEEWRKRTTPTNN